MCVHDVGGGGILLALKELFMGQMKVVILMATYNGELFLREQLDSILRQSYQDWTLYIMDDMSEDGTRHIIEEYERMDSRIISLPNHVKRGAKGTFEALMAGAHEAAYYMFADQDDVWLERKISLTLKKMQAEENGLVDIPVIVHSDLVVVDKTLSVIAPSFWHYSRISPRLLTSVEDLSVHNLVTGCTMMFNAAARALSLPFPKTALMHDSWVALSTAVHRGKIVSIETPLVLYRQHSCNVLGAKDFRGHYLFKKISSGVGLITDNFAAYRVVHEVAGLTFWNYCYHKWLYYKRYNKLIKG